MQCSFTRVCALALGSGWIEYRDSDAYATGQALVALHDAGLAPASKAYQRGVKFLLDVPTVPGGESGEKRTTVAVNRSR